MIKFIKRIFIACLLTLGFNFLEYGLKWTRWDQFAYPILLTSITYLILYVPKFRKLSLITSFIFILLMIFLYLMNELNLSNAFGSFGFALLLITLSIYLPQIIRKGFIEEF